MRITEIALICVLLLPVVGCENAGRRVAVATKVVDLRQQNQQCKDKLQKSQAEVEQLKKQIAVLSELKSGLKLENLYNLQSAQITRYTGLYEDDTGKKERLIVYIEPVDDVGDAIKATASVDIQLWDLNRPAHALLGQWHIEPVELKKMWMTTCFSINYRLVFDVGDKIANTTGDMIVKVTFTDYIFGKVFTTERIIKRD